MRSEQKKASNTTPDTIAAISTAAGGAGIGIVRLSGSGAVEIVSKIFKPTSEKNLKKQPSFTLHHGYIFNEEDNCLDEVLLSLMRSPKSYTAEDVVEINCHGGSVVLRAILELVLRKGARLAEPGEFTKRAYLNGRIDLTQAEAVADIISAKTNLALRAAQSRLQGSLSVFVEKTKEILVDVVAQLQVALDFSDEDIDPDDYTTLINKLDDSAEQIIKLLRIGKDAEILKEGIKTAIIGGVNVGKSSLLNALLRRERAIVTEIEGTTRDLLEETINVNGIPLVLQDTAGIRGAVDKVEKLGVKISENTLKMADIILLVVDQTKPLGKTEKTLIEKARNKKLIIVLNKSDLKKRLTTRDFKQHKGSIVRVSALKREGLEALKTKIIDLCVTHKIEPENVAVANTRQTKALKDALLKIRSAQELLKKAESEEIVVFELENTLKALGQVIGEVSTEDILDRIFGRFCIGK